MSLLGLSLKTEIFVRASYFVVTIYENQQNLENKRGTVIEEFAHRRAYCKIGFYFENQLLNIATSLETHCHVFMLIQGSYAGLKAKISKATFSKLQMSFPQNKYFSRPPFYGQNLQLKTYPSLVNHVNYKKVLHLHFFCNF